MKILAPVRAACRKFLLLPVLSLAGCGEEWSISKILVNSQPLGGVANVTPLSMVAPTNGGIASFAVPLEVVVQRAQGSTSPIFLRTNLLFSRQNQPSIVLHTGLSQRIEANQSRRNQTLIQVFCFRNGAQAVLSISRPSGSGGTASVATAFMSVSGNPSATTSVDIGIESGKDGNDFPIGRNADVPLQITCSAQSPIN
jgi:hypothetical protein